MDEILIASILQCRVAEAYCRLEGMRAANLERMAKGQSLAYGKEAFTKLVDEIGLHHNAVFTTIHKMRDC